MSTLRVNTIQNSGGTGSPEINGLARAWVNFNGTGTVAIRASLNVSSITDLGTGQYTVNFTNALTDASYSAICTAGNNNGNTAWALGPSFSQTSSAYSFITINSSQNYADFPNVAVAIFR